MKVFKKVLTAIGHFFRNIWRYIMANAWIQPILIVALIFAIIFGLTGIPKLVDTVKGWFDDTTDSSIKLKYRKTIDYDDFIELYEGGEKFVVVFGADDCTNCKKLYSTINTYMDDKDHREIADTKIYFFNVSKLLDKIEDEIEKYGNGEEFDKESKAFPKYEKIANIIYDGYEKVLSEFNNDAHYADREKEFAKFSSTWEIQTPTTVFFNANENGASTVFNMVVGTWEYKYDYSDINTLFTCWHNNDEKARDKLLDNYTGA